MIALLFSSHRHLGLRARRYVGEFRDARDRTVGVCVFAAIYHPVGTPIGGSTPRLVRGRTMAFNICGNIGSIASGAPR